MKTGERKPSSLIVLHLTAEGKAAFKRVDHTLEELQKLVGGYLEPIRLTPTLANRGILALVDEDGQVMGRRSNPFSRSVLRDVFGKRLVVGDALVLKERGSEFDSLDEGDMTLLRLLLEEAGVHAAP